MHIYCVGQGKQTVVIETDATYDSITWSNVQSQLAGNARVCIYDWAGRNWSGISSQARSAENITDELHDLLKAAGVAPGFVLVGDREGAVYARMYAWRYPGEVNALLLVNEMSVTPDLYSQMLIIPNLAMLSLTPLGTLAWFIGGDKYIRSSKSPCPTWMDVSACDVSKGWKSDSYGMQTTVMERFSIPAAMRTLLEPQVQYGDLPIVILTSQLSSAEAQAAYGNLTARKVRQGATHPKGERAVD